MTEVDGGRACCSEGGHSGQDDSAVEGSGGFMESTHNPRDVHLRRCQRESKGLSQAPSADAVVGLRRRKVAAWRAMST